jgi:hypothetical protein
MLPDSEACQAMGIRDLALMDKIGGAYVEGVFR